MPTWSPLAAKLSIRQVEALQTADRLGDSLDQAVNAWWRRLLRALKHLPPRLLPDQRPLVALFAELPGILGHTFGAGLAQLYLWGHESAVEPLRHLLPVRLMRVHLREDQETPSGRLEVPEPAESIDKAQLWKALKQMMWPAPSIQQTSEVVYAGAWPERLAAISKLAAPQLMAQAVAVGLAKGENLQQLAKRLAPDLNGVKASARRLARTEGMRVAHEGQMRAWDKLGDKIVGYQVHATLDQHTRPWHAHRSGTIYYKHPEEAGQKGLAQMPRPPLEADDAAERPAGSPHVAHN